MIRALIALVLLAYAIAAWTFWTVPARAGATICGTASFYADAHHGRTMANGQPFDMNAMTAAMWGPAFGARYRVTRGDRAVVVTITDRGPAKRLNRVIDLSKAAAAKLDMLIVGTADVCLTRLR